MKQLGLLLLLAVLAAPCAAQLWREDTDRIQGPPPGNRDRLRAHNISRGQGRGGLEKNAARGPDRAGRAQHSSEVKQSFGAASLNFGDRRRRIVDIEPNLIDGGHHRWAYPLKKQRFEKLRARTVVEHRTYPVVRVKLYPLVKHRPFIKPVYKTIVKQVDAPYPVANHVPVFTSLPGDVPAGSHHLGKHHHRYHHFESGYQQRPYFGHEYSLNKHKYHLHRDYEHFINHDSYHLDLSLNSVF